MKSLNAFGQFLQEKRRKAGLTQDDVAKELLYRSAQFISNWERGVSLPPMNTLGKLAELYSINVDTLFDYLLQISLDSAETSMRNEYAQSIKSKKI